MKRESEKGSYRYFVPNNWNVSLAVLITVILGVTLYYYHLIQNQFNRVSRCKLTMCSSFDFLSFKALLAVIEIIVMLAIVYVAVSIATYFTGILKDKSTIKKIIYAIVIFLILGLLTNAIGTTILIESYNSGGAPSPVSPTLLIEDISCYNEKGRGTISVLLHNYGRMNLDLDPVDLEISDFDTGSLNATLTRRNISLLSNETSKGITTSGDPDISSPADSTVYNITLEKRLEPGKRYVADFIFKNEEGLERDRPCEAMQNRP